jgi:hypothetical protein
VNAAAPETPRCPSRWEETACELPAGHAGQHEADRGLSFWIDDVPAPAPARTGLASALTAGEKRTAALAALNAAVVAYEKAVEVHERAKVSDTRASRDELCRLCDAVVAADRTVSDAAVAFCHADREASR